MKEEERSAHSLFRLLDIHAPNRHHIGKLVASHPADQAVIEGEAYITNVSISYLVGGIEQAAKDEPATRPGV